MRSARARQAALREHVRVRCVAVLQKPGHQRQQPPCARTARALAGCIWEGGALLPLAAVGGQRGLERGCLLYTSDAADDM
eukprot:1770321-Alexandrium_andersonii.AAC.1